MIDMKTDALTITVGGHLPIFKPTFHILFLIANEFLSHNFSS
jgi:hypothetical protein